MKITKEHFGKKMRRKDWANLNEVEVKTQAKTIKTTIGLEVPLLPNFIKTIPTGTMIAVQDIDEQALRELGAAFTEALIEKARKKRLMK